MEVFGKVLKDTLNSDNSVYYVIERDDNHLTVADAQDYFRTYDDFSEMEQKLLNKAEGDILELAAGAGRMSLYLQEKGFKVLATDISSGAIDVCEKRGINYTKVFDFTSPKQLMFLQDSYETIIIFGNSLPAIGNKDKLIELLDGLWDKTRDNGIILGDFVSPIPVDDQVHQNYHEKNREEGNPIGKLKMRVRYNNLIGNWIDFWLPTRDEFIEAVEATKWDFMLHGDRVFYFELFKN